jgi:hypothetical protein
MRLSASPRSGPATCVTTRCACEAASLRMSSSCLVHDLMWNVPVRLGRCRWLARLAQLMGSVRPLGRAIPRANSSDEMEIAKLSYGEVGAS